MRPGAIQTAKSSRSTKAVIAEPAVINADPFGEAWLFRMRITGTPELPDAGVYTTLVTGPGAWGKDAGAPRHRQPFELPRRSRGVTLD
jgi:hypothetical protein